MQRTLVLMLALLCAVCAWPASGADLTAIADANTDQSAPTVNFGRNGVLGVSAARVALIRFDPAKLAQIAGSTATLNIQVNLTKNASNAVAARLVLANWNEQTVTASSLPALATTVLDQKTILGADQGHVVSLDVSAAVAAWRANPSANFGIALTPLSPTPNLQLGSREGGAPATLTVVADSPDLATVLASLPCIPEPSGGCARHLPAGVFISRTRFEVGNLVGAGKGETIILLESPELSQVTSTHLADLTIVNSGRQFALVVARGRYERVAFLGDLGIQVVFPHDVIFTECDITGVGRAVELWGDELEGPTSIKFIRSRIIATGTSGFAQGVSFNPDGPGPLAATFEDTEIGAYASNQAIGIQLLQNGLAPLNLVRGSITAVGSDAYGIDGGIGPGLQVLGTRISARGSSSVFGIGVQYAPTGESVFDGALINATRLAVNMVSTPAQPVPRVLVMRSQFESDNTAFTASGVPVTLQSSIFKAPTAVRVGSPVTATSSKFAGAVDLRGPSTCDRVYNSALALLNPNCSAP